MMNLFILSCVLVGALSALFCRQTIYALLSLMTTFVMSALFFFQLHLYFIGSILIIVYVGAITMLFLYVVMFLDIKRYARIRKNTNKRFFKFVAILWCVISQFVALTDVEKELLAKNESNTVVFSVLRENADAVIVGQTLYTFYGQLVLVVGFLLFIVIVVATDISQPKSLQTKKY